MATNRPFLVRQLIEDAGFELELMGGEAGIGRECRGVYVGEHLDPTPWMARGSIHLTAGLALAGCEDPAEGARLLRRLDAAGMAGLGVSIPHYLAAVPAPMRREADRLGFPLFAVTGNTLFRDIEQYVYDVLASEELHRLRRTLSAQQQLLEIMAGEAAPAGLAARLAVLLQASVLLVDAQGSPLAAHAPSGPVAPDAAASLAAEAWAAYAEGDHDTLPRTAFAMGSRRLLWREVVVGGRLHMVMLVLTHEHRPQDEFAGPTLDYAKRLLEVDLRRRLPAAAGGDGLLLRELLSPGGAGVACSERLAARGIHDSTAYRLAVVRPRTANGEGPAAVTTSTGDERTAIQACAAVFGRHDLRFLLTATDDGGAVALLAEGRHGGGCGDGALAAELAESLLVEGDAWVVGFSEECLELRWTHRAYTHAMQAAAALARPADRQDDPVAICFDQLASRRQTLDLLTSAELETLTRALTPLRSADRTGTGGLEASLQCYLRHDGSIAAAARALDVHRNTLCKRLARIERLTGVDVGVIDDVVDIRLAFDAEEILRSREAAARL